MLAFSDGAMCKVYIKGRYDMFSKQLLGCFAIECDAGNSGLNVEKLCKVVAYNAVSADVRIQAARSDALSKYIPNDDMVGNQKLFFFAIGINGATAQSLQDWPECIAWMRIVFGPPAKPRLASSPVSSTGQLWPRLEQKR